jgi:hypothetical protein
MLSLRDKKTGRRVCNEQGELVEKNYDNRTVNWIFGILSVMLGEAVRRKIIKFNPCNNVGRFMETDKDI